LRAFALLALVCVTAVWGYTFVVVRDAVRIYPVVPFLSLRFCLAAVLLTPLLVRGRADLRAGIVPGLALGVGYLCQTVGLQYTTASQAGLLTGLFVVITPVFETVAYRTMPRQVTIAAVVAAFAGTALLAAPGGVSVGHMQLVGDGLEVLTAVAFSIHLLLVGRATTGRSSGQLAFAQIATAGIAFTLGASATHGYPRPEVDVWTALAITAGLATALAFWIQTRVQQYLSPSRTALVLVLEPAFATLFGFLLAGDSFTRVQAAGAALILLAIVGHESVVARRPLPTRLGET
jgi:drug/metabolite transporter (DMT)-like permease